MENQRSRSSAHQKTFKSHVKTEDKGYNTSSLDSFIKFLNNDDMASKLQIPSKFMMRHGTTLLRSCLLRESGNPSTGWPVSLDCIGEYSFFVDGWSIFAKDTHLKPGEYLHFIYMGNSKFEVSVYETTGCKRDFSTHVFEGLNEPENTETETNHVGEKSNNSKRKRKSYTFFKDLSPSQTVKYFIMPKSFMIETGIRSNLTVDIHDEEGRVWPAMIKYSRSGFLMLCQGWLDFLRDKKIVAHSRNKVWCKFTPGPKNIMEIRIT